VECKLRWVNIRRVSDPRRAFRPAFGVTGISDDCYMCTMGVIVISLRTPRSARENFGCTWEHLGAPATSLGTPMTSFGTLTTHLGAPTPSLGTLTTSLGAPTKCLGAPRITGMQSGKNDIFFGNVAGAPGNHSYYLSFNNS
jgi:hypothetical protein